MKKSILKTPTFLIMGVMVLFTIIAYVVKFTSDTAQEAMANFNHSPGWVVFGVLLNIIGVSFLFYRQNLMVKNHNATIEEDDTWVVLVATLVYLAGVAIVLATLTSQVRY